MKLWARLLVSLGILLALLVLLPWAEVRDAFGRLRLTSWLLVVGVFLLGHVVGAAKWRLLVRAGGGALGRYDALRCHAAGLFANLCLPSIVGGDVLRGLLAARTGARGHAALLGGLMDRVLDVFGLGALILVGALVAQRSVDYAPVRIVLLALVVGGAIGLLALWMASRRRLDRWPARARRHIGRSLVALRRLGRRPGTAAVALTLSIGMQATFILLNAWIGRQIGIDLPTAVWFVAWPIAKIVALAPISLGGLGVRDATLGGLLAPLGIPAALGVVSSLIWQTVMIAGGLLAGLFWWASSRGEGVRLRSVAVRSSG